MKKLFIASAALYALPLVAMAATLDSILIDIGSLIDRATPLVVALALLFFFWGLMKYILSAGDEEKKSEGRNIMIWGIIALFVMLSVFGLVEVLQNTFDVKDVNIPVPSV